MGTFVDSICAKTSSQTELGTETLIQQYFLWEREEHLSALANGSAPPVSPVHFWTRRCCKPEQLIRTRTNPEPPRIWSCDTLLISGYDIFQMLNKKVLHKWIKSRPTSRDGIKESDFGFDASPATCLWTAYQKLPPGVRLEFNATAYELTAERCRVVKDVELDPPKRVKASTILATLSEFTAADTAQLIIDFAVDPYLPNHLRCCASTPLAHRCPFPRFRRYCPIPVGCCNGFKIEPNACLYDVCSFHLLKINQNQTYVLVSCD